MSNCRALGLVFLALVWGGSPSPLGALDFAAEGKKQLALGNYPKATTALEAALAQGSPSEELLLNLGLVYQKTGRPREAAETFALGAQAAGPARATFLLNGGLSLALAGDSAGAERVLTELLTLVPDSAPGYLARANLRVSGGDLARAAEDYRVYQTLAPNNPQKATIARLLDLLDQAVLDAEAAKAAEALKVKRQQEEAAALAEAQRQAAEAAAEAQRQAVEAAAEAQRRAEAAVAEAQRQAAEAAEAAAAEEERRQAEILARIRESLAGAGEDSKALSSGPGGVKADEGEFSLED